MIRLALIGKSIAHSRSPEIYRQLLGLPLDYQLLNCTNPHEIPSVEELLVRYDGVSITSPYKTYFNGKVEADSSALQADSINCLYRTSSQQLMGANTDWLALQYLLPHYFSENLLQQVVIMGAGPMAKVVQRICEQAHLPYSVLTRQQDGDLSHYCFTHQNALIVNCCSRSMLFSGSLPLSSVFFDLNYGLLHPFFRTLRHFRFIDGAEMLQVQAVQALKLWKLLPDKNS